MTTAKKAKSPSIVDDEEAMVEKIANDIKPSAGVERPNARAMPASASERPNGEPSQGPNEEVGMTVVVDRAAPQTQDNEETVRLVNVDGVELDVPVADVKMHERSGWKRLKEEEA
jgi:hypothetical protein